MRLTRRTKGLAVIASGTMCAALLLPSAAWMPGATAEVNVLAGQADTSVKCSRPTWAVTLPGGLKIFSPPPSPGSPTVCANGNVEISPVYAKNASSR